MGMYFSISSFVFISILTIIFFSKGSVVNEETKLYKRLLIITLIGLSLEIISGLLFHFETDKISTIYIIVSKITSSYFTIWSFLFLSYLMCISNINKKLWKILLVIFLVSYIAIIILPIKFTYTENMLLVPAGPSVILVYSLCAFFTLLDIIIYILYRKKVSQKKFSPLISLVVIGVVFFIITAVKPDLFLMSFAFALIDLIMYFTIENPDIRLVEYEKKEKELAQSASEAKSAFLSSMSHELRTPLNAIVGLSEDILSYKDQVPKEIREDSIDIVNASNTLLELIGNILDISKIEGGKLELIEADYLPHEEFDSLLKIMRTKMEEKDLTFNIYIDPNIPECLYGDRLRIKQIINNFLSNSAKYTEKGSVSFGIRWVNNGLQIRVADTGRGIKEEDKSKLFEKFERLHVEKTSSVQGTGLGLAITKNLVDLMGGTINVTSVFGQGSTFDVFIPQKLGNKENIVRENLSKEDKKTVDYTGKKVLVVDDNKLNIKVLRKAIATFNFEIDECYDGKQALDKIASNSYDLILMDIMMPVMGGEETMGVLKSNPNFNTPVIALTADATTGAKERYLSCGFKDYLAKPFSREIIAQKLDNVLGDTK